jgi:hypothetical protein
MEEIMNANKSLETPNWVASHIKEDGCNCAPLAAVEHGERFAEAENDVAVAILAEKIADRA